MNVRAREVRFTIDHEWVRLEGDGTAVIGITDHAQGLLGDIVFVQLPDAGADLAQGQMAVVLESVKAAGEINMPVAGRVLQANTALPDDPSLVNRDPMGEGWFLKIGLDDPSSLDALMDQRQYDAFVADQA